eukprot:1449740-Rhodomonas_salina.3
MSGTDIERMPLAHTLSLYAFAVLTQCMPLAHTLSLYACARRCPALTQRTLLPDGRIKGGGTRRGDAISESRGLVCPCAYART